MLPPDIKTERRQSIRHRVFKEGRIIIEGHSTINCVVRDLSDAGAKLRVQSTIDLPHAFDLLIVTGGLVFHSTRVWQTDDLIGVKFSNAPTNAP